MLIGKQIQLALVVCLLVQAVDVLGQSKETRPHRFVPIAPMSQDVDILYGNPEKKGEPFVMRIRELPGGVIPPHRHPIDEHITVVQGTLYFGIGDKFDYSAMKE